VHSFVCAFVCSLVHSLFVHPGIRAFVAKLSPLFINPPSPEGAKYPSTGCSPVFSFVRAPAPAKAPPRSQFHPRPP
jgi:hypothetical protein